MTELQESLSKCRIEGNTLFLPPISEGMLANYKDVRTALLNAGAKYKRNTFIFPNDAQPYIERLMGGEKVNIKKEFQFFGTPDALADRLVELAEIRPTDTVLEPSAGQGAIIHAIQRAHGDSTFISYFELMDINCEVLERKINAKEINARFIGLDFLAPSSPAFFDRVIANPPFSNNQDIDHIRKMHEVCKEGGRIVSIASNSWRTANSKKKKAFADWLNDINADIEDIPRGAFKESGTTVGGCIIIINK